MDIDEAMKLLAALEREEVRYVLIGSMAMAVLGVVRATRDIDFFVDPTPENVERLRRALRSVYTDPSIDEITSEDLAGDYPAIRYVPPEGEFSLDILARLGQRFSFADIESQDVMLEGVTIRVATPRMLVRMKRDTVRPQDRLDAAELRRRFDIEDE